MSAVGQSRSTTPNPASRTGVNAGEITAVDLNSLQQAQARALTSGDTSAIAATSNALAVSLLHHLAALERAEGNAERATELDIKARLLEAEASGPSVAPESPTLPHTARQQPATQHSAIGKEEAEKARLKKLLAQSYNDLGTAEARQGQYGPAKRHFEEAAFWDAPDATLLRNLGTAAFRVGDFPAAVQALGQYLQLNPASAGGTDPRSQLLYALSLFSVGDFSAASRAFAPVSAAALKDPRSAYSWAFSLAHSGDPKQANTIAAQLSTQPLPSTVLALVCHIFMDTESYEQSAACYRKITAADPAFRLAHYQIAEALIRMDKPGEAIPELRQELVLSPDDPNVEYSLAFALLQTSSKDEARALLTSITAAHPEMAQAQYQLGKLLLESGETPAALSHLELAEKADPSSDYIHYQLQAVYRKLGRTADADREARLYREIKERRRALPASTR